MVNSTTTTMHSGHISDHASSSATQNRSNGKTGISGGAPRLFPYDWTIGIDARFSERDLVGALDLLGSKVVERGYRPPNKYVHILLLIALNRHDKYLSSTYRSHLSGKHIPDPLPKIALRILESVTFPHEYLPSYNSTIPISLNYSSTGTSLCIFGGAYDMILQACFNGERCKGIWDLILEERGVYRERKEEMRKRRRLGALGDVEMPKVMRRNLKQANQVDGQGLDKGMESEDDGLGGDGSEGVDERVITKEAWGVLGWMVQAWENEARADPNNYSPSFTSQIPPVTTYEPLLPSTTAVATQPTFQLDQPFEIIRRAYARSTLAGEGEVNSLAECKAVEEAKARRKLTQATFTTPSQISRTALRDNLLGLYHDLKSSAARAYLMDDLLYVGYGPMRGNSSQEGMEFLLEVGEEMERRMEGAEGEGGGMDED